MVSAAGSQSLLFSTYPFGAAQALIDTAGSPYLSLSSSRKYVFTGISPSSIALLQLLSSPSHFSAPFGLASALVSSQSWLLPTNGSITGLLHSSFGAFGLP